MVARNEQVSYRIDPLDPGWGGEGRSLRGRRVQGVSSIGPTSSRINRLPMASPGDRRGNVSTHEAPQSEKAWTGGLRSVAKRRSGAMTRRRARPVT